MGAEAGAFDNRMNVLVTNTVALNTGDSAILHALVQQVNEAWQPRQIVVHDKHAEAAQALYPDLTIRPCLSQPIAARGPLERRWRGKRAGKALLNLRFWLAAQAVRSGRFGAARRLLRAEEAQSLMDYKEADVVITTGGTYLVEHYSIGPRLRTFWLSRVLRKPLVFYTQSLGPFRQPANQQAMRASVERAALVLLRDERSRGYLREIGADGPRVHVVADSVFALDPPLPTKPKAGARPRVAFSVRKWQHFDSETAEAGMARYARAVCRAAEVLVRDYGAEVVFLSTCQGVPAYTADDSAVAAAMAAQLPRDVQAHVTVDRDFHTPQSFMEAVAGCSLMISTRMHGAILGLVSGVPVLPIAYEFKTEEVYAQMGLAEWVERVDDVSPESLEAQVHRFMADPAATRKAMVEGVARQRGWAQQAVKHLQRLSVNPLSA